MVVDRKIGEHEVEPSEIQQKLIGDGAKAKKILIVYSADIPGWDSYAEYIVKTTIADIGDGHPSFPIGDMQYFAVNGQLYSQFTEPLYYDREHRERGDHFAYSTRETTYDGLYAAINKRHDCVYSRLLYVNGHFALPATDTVYAQLHLDDGEIRLHDGKSNLDYPGFDHWRVPLTRVSELRTAFAMYVRETGKRAALLDDSLLVPFDDENMALALESNASLEEHDERYTPTLAKIMAAREVNETLDKVRRYEFHYKDVCALARAWERYEGEHGIDPERGQ